MYINEEMKQDYDVIAVRSGQSLVVEFSRVGGISGRVTEEGLKKVCSDGGYKYCIMESING